MANEVTVTCTLAYADAAGVSDQLSVSGLQYSPATTRDAKTRQTIATSETALKLGDLSAPGYVQIRNLGTNPIDVKTAASGTIFCRLDASGGVCLLKLGSGAQVPVLIASGGSSDIDVLVTAA